MVPGGATTNGEVDPAWDQRQAALEGMLNGVAKLAVMGIGALLGGAAVSVGKKLKGSLKKAVSKLAKKPQRGRRKLSNKTCPVCKPGSGTKRTRAAGGRCNVCSKCGYKANGQPRAQGVNKKVKTCNKCKGNCFSAGTLVATASERRAIDQIRLGERVMTWRPGEAGYGDTTQDGPNGTWREVWFVREWSDGQRAEVGLLRPASWLLDNGVISEGDQVELNLPEMDVVGTFKVTSVNYSPAIQEGPGRIVTGVFRFSQGRTHELKVAGEPEPIRVTGLHPIWSADREDWVPSGELRVGEKLSTDTGNVEVESISQQLADEPVYNIEVDGDHCYRVGEQGGKTVQSIRTPIAKHGTKRRKNGMWISVCRAKMVRTQSYIELIILRLWGEFLQVKSDVARWPASWTWRNTTGWLSPARARHCRTCRSKVR